MISLARLGPDINSNQFVVVVISILDCQMSVSLSICLVFSVSPSRVVMPSSNYNNLSSSHRNILYICVAVKQLKFSTVYTNKIHFSINPSKFLDLFDSSFQKY